MIVGIVLAAGRGERIGQPKAWLQTGREGESFLGRAYGLLQGAGIDRIIGVVPAGSERFAHGMAPGAILVPNPWPEEGQLASLQLGLRAAAALELDPEAVIVLPVDVPLVQPSTVSALIGRWRASRPAVVRPISAEGRHGHPVIFSSELFDALLNADRTLGAKPIVRANVSAAGDVLVDDEGAFQDIDTAEDYRRAFGRLP